MIPYNTKETASTGVLIYNYLNKEVEDSATMLLDILNDSALSRDLVGIHNGLKN